MFLLTWDDRLESRQEKTASWAVVVKCGLVLHASDEFASPLQRFHRANVGHLHVAQLAVRISKVHLESPGEAGICFVEGPHEAGGKSGKRQALLIHG